MYLFQVESDQLYTWSDKNEEERTCCQLETTLSGSPAPTASTQGDPARLADRALQTLWQARVQVRRWSRSWTQVLPSDLLISRNLRCPQLVDQLEFRIGEDRGGGVELIAQIADHFIVGGVREMMQSHGQGFVLKIWN